MIAIFFCFFVGFLEEKKRTEENHLLIRAVHPPPPDLSLGLSLVGLLDSSSLLAPYILNIIQFQINLSHIFLFVFVSIKNARGREREGEWGAIVRGLSDFIAKQKDLNTNHKKLKPKIKIIK